MESKVLSIMILAMFSVGMLTLPFSTKLTQETSQVHDIAVTTVETFKIVCGTVHYVKIVFEEHSICINATVENQGDFEETFNVTAKYDDKIIQTINGVYLAAHTSTNMTFSWNTKGVTKGNYIISAGASVVPDEVDIADNTFSNLTVTVTWLGDMDGDCDIDEDDLWHFCAMFLFYYKTYPRRLDPRCDLDEDCDIDEDDLWIFCSAFIQYYKRE
jgi:hypothetical protein